MLIGSSIPGETPIDDISGLKIREIKTRKDLNAFEAKNVRKAISKYLSQKPTPKRAPFTLEWAKKLHKEMFSDVWKWGGTFRESDLNLGVPYGQIETQLYGLLKDLTFWGECNTPLLAQAARLHYRAVIIHPFLNGNGRWSRLLANIWLARNSSPVTQWPEDTIGDTSSIRNDYILALKAADIGDEEPLLALHQRYTFATH
jgi:Fic-DOC domain mobile mystery protein B